MKFQWVDRAAAVKRAAEEGIKHNYTAEEAAKIFLIATSGRYVKRADEMNETQLKRFINDVEREMKRKRV